MNSNKTQRYQPPMSYSGLLDDAVHRYAITPEVDADFFSKSIVRNVFFSGRMYINDGYLVNHPDALRQLVTDGSLLREMIDHQFLLVLARQPDPEGFSDNPERMAAAGVTSFQKLVRSAEWDDIKRQLRRLAERWFEYDLVESWPALQMHEGFKSLFERAFSLPSTSFALPHGREAVIDDFRHRYYTHESYEKAPRTAVEEAALAMQRDGHVNGKFVCAMMNVANQCYHYNFAMCLGGERGHNIVADTTIGPAFQDILAADDPVDADLDSIPILSIPHGFPLHDGQALRALFKASSDLRDAKTDFLQELDRVFTQPIGGTPKDRAKALREAAERYRFLLAEHFAKTIGLKDLAPRRHALLTFGLGSVRDQVEGATELFLASNLAGGQRISSFLHRVTEPLRRHLLEVGFDPDAGEEDRMIFRGGDVRPRFAALSFDHKAASSHVASVPAFTPTA